MINPGSRPSRLALARHATGEIDLDASAPSSQAYLAALDAERARVPSFDFAVLAAHAARLEEHAPDRVAAAGGTAPRGAPAAAPAPTPWWRRFWYAGPVLAFAAAAAITFIVDPAECAPGDTRPGCAANRMKGDADLGFYVLRGDQVYPGDTNEVFHAGDRLQFTYRGPYSTLVLLSVDGEGTPTVFYPEAGEDGVPILPGDRHVLDGSIILDDAPGPEVFLGFFGEEWTVSEARAAALGAWESGGTGALVALAQDPTVSALALEKE